MRPLFFTQKITACHASSIDFSPKELAVLRDWVKRYHLPHKNTPIKEEGYVLTVGEQTPRSVKIAGLSGSETIETPQNVLLLLEKLVQRFIAKTQEAFPLEYEGWRSGLSKITYGILSYIADSPNSVVKGVPYHQDRVPTTLLFNFLLESPRQGGTFEVKDLDTGTVESYSEENTAILFDDRNCLHRVLDMRGNRKALTFRLNEPK